MNILVEKWSHSGLLKALNSADVEICAEILENASKFMIEKRCTSEFSTRTLLPALRRIFSNYKKIEESDFIRLDQILTSRDETEPTIIKCMLDRECEIIAEAAKEFLNECSIQ